MLRKVFKTGNSIVVSFPKDALDYLGIQEGVEVEVALDRERRQIVITPVSASLEAVGIDEAFARQVSEFIEQYRPALQALAK